MGIRIAGMNAIVPHTVRRAASDSSSGGGPENVTGVRTVRVAVEGQTSTDLAGVAATRLLAHLKLGPADLDGLVFVSQTPDYILPASACVLQRRLGLSKGVFAFDVGLGCSAYPYGLAIASSLITARMGNRVLLLVGDVSSLLAHADDRGVSHLFGDSATATILEWHEDRNDIVALDLGTDGAGEEYLMVPVGLARYRTLEAFRKRAPESLAQSVKHPHHLHMSGAEIFSFTLREVPGIASRVLQRAGLAISDVDYFLFHQANQFIINHLIRKMKLAADRCPTSIAEFGNTSGASPVVTACQCLADINRERELTAMIIAFGVGFSWGGALVNLAKGSVFPIEEA